MKRATRLVNNKTDDDFFGIPEVEGESEQVEEGSFDDIPLNPEPLSIESMLHVAQSSPPTTSYPHSTPPAIAFSLPTHAQSTPPSPPPRVNRVRHAEREDLDDSYEGPVDLNSIESLLHSFPKRSESTPPATPPATPPHLRATPSQPARTVPSTDSKIPLKKSARRATPSPSTGVLGFDHAVRMLPLSPSPAKSKRVIPNADVSVSKFSLDFPRNSGLFLLPP